MKYLREAASVVLVLLAFLAAAIPAQAAELGLATEPLSAEQEATVWSNIEITLLETPPRKFGIKNFDVSGEGLIAIGSENTVEKIIAVYDPEGTFLYGYTFENDGTFRLQWVGENIFIQLIRSDLGVTVDRTGQILSIVNISDTMENNSYINHVLEAKKRTRGDSVFYLKDGNDSFDFSYSQLVRVDDDGSEHILYDVSTEQFIKGNAALFLAALVAFIVLSTVKQELAKRRQDF